MATVVRGPRKPTEMVVVLIAFLMAIIATVQPSPVSFSAVPVPVDGSEAKTRHTDHYRRVVSAARCFEPKERVVHLKDLIPDPGLVFIPDCTTLHQCGQDTGCCPGGQICGAKETEDIELVFKVFRMNPGGKPKVSTEAYKFTNHTSCACSDRNDIPR